MRENSKISSNIEKINLGREDAEDVVGVVINLLFLFVTSTHKRRALRRYIQWTKVSIYYIGCPIDHVRPNQLDFYMYTRLVVAGFYARESHHQYDDNTP